MKKGHRLSKFEVISQYKKKGQQPVTCTSLSQSLFSMSNEFQNIPADRPAQPKGMTLIPCRWINQGESEGLYERAPIT